MLLEQGYIKTHIIKRYQTSSIVFLSLLNYFKRQKRNFSVDCCVNYITKNILSSKSMPGFKKVLVKIFVEKYSEKNNSGEQKNDN